MTKATQHRIQTALLSVSDKTGIVELAQQLVKHGVTLLSTGGTAALLQQHNIAVTQVSEHTGCAEMLDGRVKTLHPKIHGGILARRGQDDASLQQHGIIPIDLVVVNLYPFSQTIADPHCTLTDAIKQIDIGGPTMLRAAAKNHAYVSVVVDPNDYADISQAIAEQGYVSSQRRVQLASKAFAHTAQYDGTIANYFEQQLLADAHYPGYYQPTYVKHSDLRYGENPHQTAAFYRDAAIQTANVASAELIQGKPLSFNNIADADSAFSCVKQLSVTTSQYACVIVKHANPCGVAIADTLEQAYQRAFITDKTSAFGGIIAVDHPLDEQTANAILTNQFCEVIIAPGISDAARQCLAQKPSIRVLITSDIDQMASPLSSVDYKKVDGGLLVQSADNGIDVPDTFTVVTQRQPTAAQYQDLLFSWTVAKYVKSNAIVYARDNATIGIGAGQMSRVISAHIAGYKAQQEGLSIAGAVMGSDAFFPFRDSVDTAAAAGIGAIIQPGGSIRDAEVIAAADEANIAMVFTHTRHFRHA